MTTREEIVRTLSQVDPELIFRFLAAARKLLAHEHYRHHQLTPHALVVRAYDEMLDGLHEADYTPNLFAFFRAVMEKIIMTSRRKSNRGARFGAIQEKFARRWQIRPRQRHIRR